MNREDFDPTIPTQDQLADISKAATFGWRPEWTLEAGLKQIVRELR